MTTSFKIDLEIENHYEEVFSEKMYLFFYQDMNPANLQMIFSKTE